MSTESNTPLTPEQAELEFYSPTPTDASTTAPPTSASEPKPENHNLNLLADYLKSDNGVSCKNGITEEGRRVLFLKGEKLLSFLSSISTASTSTSRKKSSFPKSLLVPTSRASSLRICNLLLRKSYILPVLKPEKKGNEKKGFLIHNRTPGSQEVFDEQGYYFWVYEGSSTKKLLMTYLLILAFFLCVLFPIWPTIMRVWIWYIAVTLLLILFSIIFVRLFFFMGFWSFGFDFWVLPRLFDEDLGVYDSFIPLLTFERAKSGSLPFRLLALASFAGFFWWAISQPTEFEGMVKAQRSFIDDMYSGKLLTDMSQNDKDNIDTVKVISLDDLLRDLEDEDEETENVQLHGEVDEDEVLEANFDELLEDLIDVEEVDNGEE